MLEGIIVLWFTLTGLSLAYITYDLYFITPEAKVMKVAWFLVCLYTGPIGLFFYLISCKEPMKGTHEEFIKPLWKQSLGSEVHCLAGDATGIITAAIWLSFVSLPVAFELFLEYLAGFLFGLFIFQALFMKNMMGGSYLKALKTTIYPEWLSMNMIMAGMIPTMLIWEKFSPLSSSPFNLHFWAKMSLASIIGGIIAYPINHWLVKNKLKHGMTTVREKSMHETHEMHHHEMPAVSKKSLFSKAVISLISLFIGCLVGFLFAIL